MKHVVSVSLGSSKRDHQVEAEFLGEKFLIERRGTDGDFEKAVALIRELDGKVDAFGLGGIDLYLVAGKRRWVIRDAQKIASAAKVTPVVDGSGLKNTLERRVVFYLQEELGWQLAGKKVLVVSAVDRFGLAEAFVEAGCDTVFGDMIFSLGIPIPIRSLKTIEFLACLLLPILCRLPFKYLYPTGSKQEKITSSHRRYYQEAEIIAGDFHFIRRYLPEQLSGKTVVTNTVTKDDLELLRDRGVRVLVTTTPELGGRSFGTNVLEAVFVSLIGKPLEEITPEDYNRLLDELKVKPRLEYLSG
ncbi:MAG: Uncharacterized protein XD63_1536 [Thermoanaerobacterales bacterium 50_218]|nr:MAG: Uncharacterized protein XD63_1536 [Thermoanaerobacterales bacterium 50_218]HAA89141.1 quinate 5-dehydrogenase [Peptococcaceae bacterium]